MRVFNVAKASPWRTAVLATVLTGAMAGSAFAAVSDLTMNSTAALSPGRLHATLTGTVTCDAGTTVFLGAQIVQSGVASGYGGSSLACDGKAQEYTADVSTGGSGVFKTGWANAEVSTIDCTEMACTTKYVDAIIRLNEMT